ncbi:hypothetical protein DEO72_LG10g326 [Vigna unguiculata]|uniref:Uncharacterized protein n=1 Tax=Vigna unguiculata TaxID=3917 RepID=A0A4D6NAY6_VIGUN|nr:hypothetical protein DEO72_LG10g326 [Vigna unguiculata]
MTTVTVGNQEGDLLTIWEVLQHIKTLRQEKKTNRKQADEEHARRQANDKRQRVEFEVERERFLKESKESRQTLEESLSGMNNYKSLTRP